MSNIKESTPKPDVEHPAYAAVSAAPAILSAAVAERPPFDPETQERVRRAVELLGYVPSKLEPCSLNCTKCQIDHKPNMVFLDVTNRCNMNCPICINNTPSMGFLFEPPIEYFDTIFKHFAQITPKPSIQLFGGEPTVRNDLFDIIKLGFKNTMAPDVACAPVFLRVI